MLLDWHNSSVSFSLSHTQVRVMRLSTFVSEVVAKRKLPEGASSKEGRPPRVLMKMDIEGFLKKKKHLELSEIVLMTT